MIRCKDLYAPVIKVAGLTNDTMKIYIVAMLSTQTGLRGYYNYKKMGKKKENMVLVQEAYSVPGKNDNVSKINLKSVFILSFLLPWASSQTGQKL